MKRTLFILVIWASLVTLNFGQWVQAYSTSMEFNGFYALDTLNIWFTHLGTDKIIRTTDGGFSFQTQTVTAGAYDKNSVYMEDINTGWCGGSGPSGGPGRIHRTTNGGTTWTLMSHPAPSPSRWNAIAKVGNVTWFAGGYGTNQGIIMTTSNSGQSWQVSPHPEFGILLDIEVIDEQNILLSGLKAIYRTSDGGVTWVDVTQNPDPVYWYYQLAFVNSNQGFSIGSNTSSGTSELYMTTNGGVTWNAQYNFPPQTGQKTALSVITGTTTIFLGGWLSETIGSYLWGIIKSSNSGMSWDTVMLSDYVPAFLSTPDPRHGWASVGPYIYRYDYVTPVTIEPISNKLIQFGQPFTYQVNAIGMGLEYSMSGNPQGLNIGTYSGLINGTPTEGGKFDITVAVQDTDANVVNEEFRLKVNRKPHFMPPPPPTHAWVDSSYQVQLNVEDVDDDTVSFSWLTKPSWLTFLTEGITNVVLQGVPGINDTGYHPIAVLADDGFGGLDTLSWVIQVELYVPPVNNLPYFSGTWPDTVVVYRDSSYTWNFLFQDIDGDTLVTQAGEVGVPGLLLLPAMGISQVTAQVTGLVTDTGWYEAIVSVNDEHGAQGQLQFTVYVDFVTSVEPIPGIPTEYALLQNYPNPFNPVTIIRYELPHNTEVNLTIYNLLGQEVEILVNEYQPIGTYEASFNASALPSGTYFYRLQADKFVQTKKMILLK